VDTGDEEEAYVVVGGKKVPQSVWGTGADPREKYDTEDQLLDQYYGPRKVEEFTIRQDLRISDAKKAYEEALAIQKKKMKTMGWLKAIPAGIVLAITKNPKLAMKTFSISKEDMINIVKNSIPVMKAKKEYERTLEETLAGYEKLGVQKFAGPHTDTKFQKREQELLDLTQTRDDEDPGDKGPELPPQLGGPSTEEMATEYVEQPDFMGWIRANQARKKAYDEKIQRERLAREENPIVTGTEMDIIAIGNKGGLANLFRVKKQ
jgi:hypothetical protein